MLSHLPLTTLTYPFSLTMTEICNIGLSYLTSYDAVQFYSFISTCHNFKSGFSINPVGGKINSLPTLMRY